MDKVLPTVTQVVERFGVATDVMYCGRSRISSTLPPTAFFNTSAVPSADTRRRIDWLFENEAYELDDSQRPDCHRTKRHRYTAVYGRMRPDEPARQLREVDRWGEGGSCTRCCGARLPHEAARIQCFPDSFDFTPTTSSRAGLAQLIGDAPSEARVRFRPRTHALNRDVGTTAA